MELLLKEFRKSRGLTQEELAAAINSTKRVIGAYERHETSIPLDVAIDITEVLGCTLDELCGRKVEHVFSDPRQTELNGHYESLNEPSKDDLVGFAKSFAADPERRIIKDSKKRFGGQAALGA